MIRKARLLAVCGLLLAAPGCASQARGRAVALADGGSAVAKATADSLVETEAAVAAYVEGQYLLGPLTGRPEPGAETLDSLRRLREALAARAAVTRSLEASYAALRALAAFDASGHVERGVAALTASVDEYGRALGRPPVDPAGAWSLGKAGGALAGADHARRLKAASAAVRGSLERYVALLGKESEVHASLRRALVEARGAAARQLWQLGLGRAGGLLQPHVAGFGLAWDDKQLDPVLTLLRKEPSITALPGRSREDDLRDAVEKVLGYRVERQAALEAEVLEATLAGLEALALAHAAFEARQDPDAARVAERAAALRSLVEEYRRVAGK